MEGMELQKSHDIQKNLRTESPLLLFSQSHLLSHQKRKRKRRPTKRMRARMKREKRMRILCKKYKNYNQKPWQL